MSRKAKAETHVVREQVYLKKPANSPFYQYYFRLNAYSFRQSTKTTDLKRAEDIALAAYYEARKLDKGAIRKKVSFKKLCGMYLEYVKHDTRYKYHKEIIETKLLPFFGKFKSVQQITNSDILDYMTQRVSRYRKKPKPQTLNRESSALRQICKFAHQKNLMEEEFEIPLSKERHAFGRRRHFTLSEYRTVLKTACKRIREVPNDGLRTTIKWRRQLLLDYIIFLANTGVRVDESKTIIWRNVDFENQTIKLENAGKVRSSRILYARPSGISALKRIYKRRLDYLQDIQSLNAIPAHEFIFCLPNGQKIGNTKTAFRALLKACGFVYKNSEEIHTLTSLRHSYATFSLTRKGPKKITTRALSMQLGTSLRMIEKHYGHDLIEDYKDEILG